MEDIGNNFREILQNPINLNGSSFKWGAHHPHCDRHENHLLWIGGHPFCLGCTCMYFGIIVGILAAFSIPWANISFGEWVVLHLTLLAPTVTQPWLQNKVFKIFSRTALGITIASYLITGLLLLPSPFGGILFRILVLLVFLSGFKMISRLRTRFTNDPCSDCPLGSYPTCDWNLPRLLQENGDSQLIAAIQDKQ